MNERSAGPFGLTAIAQPERHPELQRLAVIAQRLLGADFAAINLMDEDMQWCVAGSPGVPMSVVARSVSLCHRILARSPRCDVFCVRGRLERPRFGRQ